MEMIECQMAVSSILRRLFDNLYSPADDSRVYSNKLKLYSNWRLWSAAVCLILSSRLCLCHYLSFIVKSYFSIQFVLWLPFYGE